MPNAALSHNFFTLTATSIFFSGQKVPPPKNAAVKKRELRYSVQDGLNIAAVLLATKRRPQSHHAT